MQKGFILLFILFCFKSNAQIKVTLKIQNVASLKSDTIYYNPSVKLIWNNFKGVPKLGTTTAAITTSGFGYASSISYDDDGGEAEIILKCFFSKKKSWVKIKNKNAYTLSHEQKHFDITYIGFNNFMKQIKKTIFNDVNTFSKTLETLYQTTYADMRKMQNDYDTETNNGQLNDKQLFWEKKIADLLVTL